MADEINLSQFRVMAAGAGLKLSEEELQRLLPGVNRSRAQAANLRDLLTLAAEPAAIFGLLKPSENSNGEK
jgi:hypothetical protein